MALIPSPAWVLLCIACAIASCTAQQLQQKKPAVVTLSTPLGILNGTRDKSYKGRPFMSFRGIPFAKAPVGKLRFAPPEPAEPWKGILDATHDGPLCIQKDYLSEGYPVLGQEDCLVLNVYVPRSRQKPKARPDVSPRPYPPYGVDQAQWESRTRTPGGQRTPDLLPVMVYVHGGGWFAGGGASVFLGPEYLMDRDVVLVTFNYRLGALGFLSTGDAAASGNWGLKDQVMALRWVQKSIRYFGGNPDHVTLFGQSAGAASVHYLMLSPMSRGLFSRAISQSGTALCPWAWPQKQPGDIARRQGQLVGCPQTDSEGLVDCLRRVPAPDLTESGFHLKVWSVDPLTVYGPVVETRCPGSPGADEPFLTAHPYALVVRGDYDHSVPWMVGVVPGEGVVRASAILGDRELLSDLNSKLDTLGPFLFELEKSVVDEAMASADVLWRNVSAHYLGSPGRQVSVNNETASGFVQMYTDRGFLHATHKALQLHISNSHSPTFLYEFTFRGRTSYSRIFGRNDDDYGVSHCDDLLYLFRTPSIFPDFPANSPELEVVDQMVTLWTNFAKFGNPTPSAIQGTKWIPISSSNIHKHLIIGTELKMKDELHEERLAFWDGLPLLENIMTSHWKSETPEIKRWLEGRMGHSLDICPN